MQVNDLKSKANRIKEEVNFKVREGLNWVHNNKEELITIAPFVVAGIGFAGRTVKSSAKRYEIRAEEKRRKLTVYDPSTGCYLNLKRPLKSSEQIMLGSKPKDMTVTQVLYSLNLIK